MNATDILRHAISSMEARATERDLPDGERSMARAVAAFNALTGRDLEEREGWLFMVALKLARGEAGAFRPDDWIDAAAYCALRAECETLEHRPEHMPGSIRYVDHDVDLEAA